MGWNKVREALGLPVPQESVRAELTRLEARCAELRAILARMKARKS